MKQFVKNKSYIILAIIILSALTLYTYFFFNEKTGYNCDEIYNLGLSNSYYSPHLSSSSAADFITENNPKTEFEEWTSGEIFHDYITVQKGQQFAYDAVWYNLSKDSHPPFYYSLLHTVSSFFPDKFSPWFALSINYICFILVIILLYKSGCEWGSSTFSLILCGFYAFSGGATDTYTFIRVYALCTLLVTLIFYLMQKFLQTDKIKYLIFLFLATMTASLTHYHLILFAFFLTFIVEIFLLIHKKCKSFFSLGFTMLFSVLSSFAIFPSAIYDLFHDSNVFANEKMSLSYQIRYITKLIVSQFTGIELPYLKTYLNIYLKSILGFSIIVLLITFFLFRKEKLASRFYRKAKMIFFALVNKAKFILSHLPNIYYILLVTAFCIYVNYIFTLPAASMKENTIRYLFPFYPLLCLLIFTIGKEILNSTLNGVLNKKILIGIACSITILCSLSSNILHSHTFLYNDITVTGLQIKDLPQNATYIAFTPHTYNKTNYAIDLDNVSNLYLICQNVNTDQDLPDSIYSLPDSSVNQHIYVLFPNTEISQITITGKRTNSEWLSLIKSLPYAEEFIWLGTDCENGYSVDIYQLR